MLQVAMQLAFKEGLVQWGEEEDGIRQNSKHCTDKCKLLAKKQGGGKVGGVGISIPHHI